MSRFSPVHYGGVANRAEAEIVAAFKVLGATSPESAKPGKEFTVDGESFDRLLRRGVIREGAPGTFYLFEAAPPKREYARNLVFWFVVIIVPVFIMQFCPGAS